MNEQDKPMTDVVATLSFIVVAKPTPGASPTKMTGAIDLDRDKHLLSDKPLRRPPVRGKPA
jgi:hypothetical protein